MTQTVTIRELQAHASEILAQLHAGDEVIVEDAGKPLAKISPVPAATQAKPGPRPLGCCKGQIWIAPDFDEELPAEFWTPSDDPLTK